MVLGSIATLGADFVDLIEDQAEWSQATFGTDEERGPLGAIKHLEKEAKEAQKAFEYYTTTQFPTTADVVAARAEFHTELADCLLLILDASRRAGLKPLDLIHAAKAKMKVNKTREYRRTEWVYEEPHYIDSEDCMGNPCQYWRVWAKSGDQTACGTGATKDEALSACRRNAEDRPIEHVR